MHFPLTFNGSHGFGLTSQSIFWMTLSYMKAKGEKASSGMTRKIHDIKERVELLGHLACPLAGTELFHKVYNTNEFCFVLGPHEQCLGPPEWHSELLRRLGSAWDKTRVGSMQGMCFTSYGPFRLVLNASDNESFYYTSQRK